MGSLTSQLIISLIDKVSGPAKGAAAALKGVANAEKALAASGSKGVDRFATSLDKARRSAERLNSVNSRGGFGWGDGFQRELNKLKLTSRELEQIGRDYAKLQSTISGSKASVGLAALDSWKSRAISNIHAVRRAEEEQQQRQERRARGFHGGVRFATGALGLGGGAYMAERVIRAGIGASADRAREMARYSLAGMSEQEKSEALAKADAVSSKFPSVGRTEVLEHIRQLRSRLGDFHHAIDNVETLSKAQVMLGTIGHGENAPEDLERLVLGLESQGIGSQPEKFKSYLNAFVRAKSLFPDLRGEDFRQYMKAANASKYGLSEEYLTSVAPTMMQHEGASNFGVMQASAFSALIGKRQKPAAQAIMQSFGLLDKNKNIINESDFIANPYKWAEANIVPALEKKGIKTDEEHRGELVKTMTQMFSNRKVGEFFASMLVNRAVIEKDRELLGRTKGTEGADQARREDPYAALAGLTKQAKDFGTALLGIKPVITAMNDAAAEFAKRTTALMKGDYLSLLPEDDQRIIRGVKGAIGPAAQIERINERIKHSPGMPKDTRDTLLLKAFDAQMEINRAKSQEGMPDTLFSEKEIEDWKKGGTPIPWKGRVPFPHRDPRGGELSGVPLPISDPRPHTVMPPVQGLDGASVVQNLDQSGAAASAGTNTGQSWKSGLSDQLEAAKAMTLAAVQDMIKMLNFSASPTISPKINMPAQPGGQAAPGKQSAADTLKHNRHSAFADGMNFGTFA